MRRHHLPQQALLALLLCGCQSQGDAGPDASTVGARPAVSDAVEATTTAPVQRRHAPQSISGPIEATLLVDGPDARGLDDEGFASDAFPPMLPMDEHHAEAWLRDDCLMCHEEGVLGAPPIRHRGMSPVLKTASCRSCHVAADPDAGPLTDMLGNERIQFAPDAFPPTLPSDENHAGAWLRTDCLQCHEGGILGAPKVRHEGMSRWLLEASCRTCHIPGSASQ